jgi:putative transposase
LHWSLLVTNTFSTLHRLPTKTAFAAQPSHWSVGFWRKSMEPASWFTTEQWTLQSKSSPKTCSPSCPSFPHVCTAAARTVIVPLDKDLAAEEKARRVMEAERRKLEKARGKAEKAEAKEKKAEERAVVKAARTVRKRRKLAPDAEAARDAREKEEEERRVARADAKKVVAAKKALEEDEKKRKREAALAAKAVRYAQKVERDAAKKPPTGKQVAARAVVVERKKLKKETAPDSCRKILLRPSRQMAVILRRWMGAYRSIYNRALDMSHRVTNADARRLRQGKVVKKYRAYNYHGYLRAAVSNESNIPEHWLRQLPSGSRKLAVKDLCEAHWSNVAKAKKDAAHQFNLRFKSKKDPTQVLRIEHTHIRINADGNSLCIFPATSKGLVRDLCREVGVEYTDNLLDIECNLAQVPGGAAITADSVITMDKARRFFISVPYRRPPPPPETQGMQAKWAALDPGERTFLTGYSPDGHAFKLGAKASGYLMRLVTKMDMLISGRDTLSCANRTHKNLKQRNALRSSIRRANRNITSLRRRVGDLVAELHWKCSAWLCANFTDIILPPFNTGKMVLKKGRCISSKTARSMLTLSFYLFRQRLVHKAAGCGVRIYIRGEEFTTKTCGNCGVLNESVGSSKVFRCDACGVEGCRDGLAARNIFLKNTTMRPVGSEPPLVEGS